jgi:hypothetical protein
MTCLGDTGGPDLQRSSSRKTKTKTKESRRATRRLLQVVKVTLLICGFIYIAVSVFVAK